MTDVYTLNDLYTMGLRAACATPDSPPEVSQLTCHAGTRYLVLGAGRSTFHRPSDIEGDYRGEYYLCLSPAYTVVTMNRYSIKHYHYAWGSPDGIDYLKLHGVLRTRAIHFFPASVLERELAGDSFPGIERCAMALTRWWDRIFLRWMYRPHPALGLALARLAGYKEGSLDSSWCIQHIPESLETIRLRLVTDDYPFTEADLRWMAALFLPVGN